MNKYQEARFGMYSAVLAHIDENLATVATVPAFETAVIAFRSVVADISATTQQKAQVIAGVSITKKNMRLALCRQATDFAAAVYAYATTVSDATLQEKVNFVHSDLLRLKDGMLAPICRNISEAATSVVNNLSAYGITTDTIGIFNVAINDFVKANSAPRNAISQRATHRTMLLALFRQADDLLKKQLDKVATKFKTTHPEFYTTYKNNRIIVDAGTSATQIKGIITGINTDDPVAGASIELIGQPVSATTDTSGVFIMKTSQPGTYSIKVSKTGYQDKTIEGVVVKLGQSVSVAIQLEAAA